MCAAQKSRRLHRAASLRGDRMGRGEMKETRARKYAAAAVIMTVILLMGGCMERKNRFVAHMEERYGETFEYKGEKRGSARSSGYTVRLSCSRFAGEEILVTQIKKDDGSFTYLDNYMAYVFHEQAKDRIEAAIGSVFSDFWIYFPVPKGVFDTGTEEFSLEDYLQEQDANLNITLLTFGEEAGEERLQALIDTFVQNEIALECTVVFVNGETERDSVTEENLAVYMARTGWYDKIADFWIKGDGEIGYRSWRQSPA